MLYIKLKMVWNMMCSDEDSTLSVNCQKIDQNHQPCITVWQIGKVNSSENYVEQNQHFQRHFKKIMTSITWTWQEAWSACQINEVILAQSRHTGAFVWFNPNQKEYSHSEIKSNLTKWEKSFVRLWRTNQMFPFWANDIVGYSISLLLGLASFMTQDFCIKSNSSYY